MYHLQDKAVGEIQLVSSQYHLIQYLKRSYIPVLELLWKLQPKVLGVQQNLLAHSILYIPEMPVYLGFLSLGIQQAFVHQLLDLMHLLEFLNANNTTLDPIQHIKKHSN